MSHSEGCLQQPSEFPNLQRNTKPLNFRAMPNPFSLQEIQQFRRETDGTQHVVHLNNAGAALPPNVVRDRVINYLQEEALYGGYEIAAKYAEELQEVYQHIARFIHCSPTEIALTENATVSFNLAFSSIPFQAGDIILTTEVEYGSNFINYLKAKKEKGVEIQLIPTDEAGGVDPAALAQLINDRVKLISITHLPTNGGLVNPAKAIGEIAKQHGILYLLDSCQSLGQLPMDVRELGCSILTGTGRKFLRGPRGTGFLYVNQEVIAQLIPPFLDNQSASWQTKDQYQIHPAAQRFENWENSKALRLGLATAIQYAQDIGMEKIWQRIQYLADYARQNLEALPEVDLYDRGKVQGGIITFRHQRLAPPDLQQLLLKHKINTSVAMQQVTLIDMQQRNLDTLNRASVHYYNTEEEVDQLIKVLQKV